MMEGRESERVLKTRRALQRMLKVRNSEMIEELNGRKVLAFLSHAHVEPDLTVEMFLLDGPVSGFGALELVDPSATEPSDALDGRWLRRVSPHVRARTRRTHGGA